MIIVVAILMGIFGFNGDMEDTTPPPTQTETTQTTSAQEAEPGTGILDIVL